MKISKISESGRYALYDEKIGSGTYKTVYKGLDKHSGIEVAWNNVSLDIKKEEKKLILNEISILENISGECPHIMKLFDVWFDKGTNSIVYITELGNYTLNSYIVKIGDLQKSVIKNWTQQILLALNYLHSNNIIHRDIKTTNIFVNSMTGNILLGDFGSARKFDRSCKTVVGTPIYMAGEVYSGEYDEKVDIYSFGLCLIEMITGEIAYKEYLSVPIFISCIITKLPNALEKVLDEDARNLILRCIDQKPENRPSATEILRDKYITQIDVGQIEINMKTLTKKLSPVPNLDLGKRLSGVKIKKIKKSSGSRDRSSTNVSPNNSARNSNGNSYENSQTTGSSSSPSNNSLTVNTPTSNSSGNSPKNILSKNNYVKDTSSKDNSSRDNSSKDNQSSISMRDSSQIISLTSDSTGNITISNKNNLSKQSPKRYSSLSPLDIENKNDKKALRESFESSKFNISDSYSNVIPIIICENNKKCESPKQTNNAKLNVTLSDNVKSSHRKRAISVNNDFII